MLTYTIAIIGTVTMMLVTSGILLFRHNVQKEVNDAECNIQAWLSNTGIGKRITSNEIDINNQTINDIRSLIEKVFTNAYINQDVFLSLRNGLKPFCEKMIVLKKKMKICAVESKTVDNIVHEYNQLSVLIGEHNKTYQKKQLNKYRVFFDNILKYPLDVQQRDAIISEEANCLVVSSAGSGKTSSIVGKVEYLTKILHVAPEKILLISYTNKAASELTNRINVKGLRGYTFHKLALDIISNEKKHKPSICDNTDAVFVSIYRKLIKDNRFKKAIFEYYIDYTALDSEEEKKATKIRKQLSSFKKKEIKALFPDMDGKPIYVRSEQEKKLCFVLTSLGLKFRYEEPYEHPLSDECHSQYKPDFSIHYDENGEHKRIYLENFGVDEHGMVPMWFAEDKGISYDEANRRYGDGITWKREVHHKFGTKLIETTSADFHYFDIVKKVKQLLDGIGVPYHELPKEQLYDMVLPQNSKEEKAIIRLAVTFITLMKTNCRNIEYVKNAAQNAGDERSTFIISSIIEPIYREYVAYMEAHHLKDFTDIIIEATLICSYWKNCHYDYIIVDEFQDISMDRCRFLQALRSGTPKAKLFCVGDDWQSIYRFSGSDLPIFTNFEKYFGYTELKKIKTTYRFGNPLVKISSEFVQKNPIQIKKRLTRYSPWQALPKISTKHDRLQEKMFTFAV